MATHRLSAALVIAALAWISGRTRGIVVINPWVPALFAYVIGAAAYLGLTWYVLARESAAALAHHAASQDTGRGTVFALVLASSAAMVGGALAVLRTMPSDLNARAALLGLTLSATVLAWVLTNTVFALRYAHAHYEGGLDATETGISSGRSGPGFAFPGNAAPAGVDFAYLAFTVGMTFQVSDVQVQSTRCRKLVLGHAMLAFAYNTLLLAFVINLLFGQLQRGVP